MKVEYPVHCVMVLNRTDTIAKKTIRKETMLLVWCIFVLERLLPNTIATLIARVFHVAQER